MMPNALASVDGTGNAATVRSAALIAMLGLHLIDGELVDVVAAEDRDVFGARVSHEVHVLEHGIGGTAIPELAEPHLRRHDLDVLGEPRQPPVAR